MPSQTSLEIHTLCQADGFDGTQIDGCFAAHDLNLGLLRRELVEYPDLITWSALDSLPELINRLIVILNFAIFRVPFCLPQSRTRSDRHQRGKRGDHRSHGLMMGNINTCTSANVPTETWKDLRRRRIDSWEKWISKGIFPTASSNLA